MSPPAATGALCTFSPPDDRPPSRPRDLVPGRLGIEVKLPGPTLPNYTRQGPVQPIVAGIPAKTDEVFSAATPSYRERIVQRNGFIPVDLDSYTLVRSIQPRMSSLAAVYPIYPKLVISYIPHLDDSELPHTSYTIQKSITLYCERKDEVNNLINC